MAKRKKKKQRAKKPAPVVRVDPFANNVRYYNAGGRSKYYTPKQNMGNTSADTSIQRAGSHLRSIARYLDENHDLCVSVLDTLVKKIVGVELVPLIAPRTRTGRPLDRLTRDLWELYADWRRRPETTREMCAGTMQRLSCRTWLRDGEIFGRHVRSANRIRRATVVEYAIDLQEPDMVPFEGGANDAPNLVQGVYKDAWGAPLAYEFYKNRPDVNTQQSFTGRQSLTYETVRINADNILHLKFMRRIRQTRGISILAAVLRRLEGLENYEESEMVAARINAAFSAAITKQAPDLGNEGSVDQPQRELTMEPGMIFDDLLPGESVVPIGADRPNPELTNFRNAQMRAIAGGTSNNYSVISRVYDGNYSAQRQEMQEGRADYDILREQYISDWLIPQWIEFVNMAQLQGEISIPNNVSRESLYYPEYSIPAVPWIDPLKEAQADVLLIENNLMSIGQFVRKHGRDPRAFFAELRAEQELKQEMGIGTAGNDQTATAQPDENDDTDDTDDTEDTENRFLAHG